MVITKGGAVISNLQPISEHEPNSRTFFFFLALLLCFDCKLSDCNRDRMACKTYNTYCLALTGNACGFLGPSLETLIYRVWGVSYLAMQDPPQHFACIIALAQGLEVLHFPDRVPKGRGPVSSAPSSQPGHGLGLTACVWLGGDSEAVPGTHLCTFTLFSMIAASFSEASKRYPEGLNWMSRGGSLTTARYSCVQTKLLREADLEKGWRALLASSLTTSGLRALTQT